MLGDPRTVRITGDDTAAVFRRTDDADAERRPERLPGRARPRGVLLVQPHLRQRRPRPVAAAAALHGGQPRPLDAPRPPRAGSRTSPAVRRAGAARRAQPHRAAGRRRLRGRPGPDGLAVRGHAPRAPGSTPGSASCPRRARRRLVERSPAAASRSPPWCPPRSPACCGASRTAPGARTSPSRPPAATSRPSRDTRTDDRTPALAGPASGTAGGWSPGCAPRTPPPAC